MAADALDCCIPRSLAALVLTMCYFGRELPHHHLDILQSIIDLVQPTYSCTPKSSHAYCHKVWTYNLKWTSGLVTLKFHVIIGSDPVLSPFCHQTIIRCFTDLLLSDNAPILLKGENKFSTKLHRHAYMRAEEIHILKVHEQNLRGFFLSLYGMSN